MAILRGCIQRGWCTGTSRTFYHHPSRYTVIRHAQTRVLVILEVDLTVTPPQIILYVTTDEWFVDLLFHSAKDTFFSSMEWSYCCGGGCMREYGVRLSFTHSVKGA